MFFPSPDVLVATRWADLARFICRPIGKILRGGRKPKKQEAHADMRLGSKAVTWGCENAGLVGMTICTPSSSFGVRLNTPYVNTVNRNVD